MSKAFLSVVIPCFNEENVITETVTRVLRTLNEAEIRHEIIVVNDGSTDNTLGVLYSLQVKNSLRIINLKKNMGHMSALRAGLEASIGSHVATIDADLQDPPEYLPDMLSKFTNKSSDMSITGYSHEIDVVQTYRADRRKDAFLKRGFASLYYLLINKLIGVSLIPQAADYRIMNRKTVDKLISLPEKRPVYRLLIPKLGFIIEPYPIVRAERLIGETKYTYKKMFSLALDSVVGFTFKPLRLITFLGITSSALLIIASFITFLISIVGNELSAWPSLVLLLLSANAFLLASLGIVGEYVGRIYEIVQNRPNSMWEELGK